MPIPETLSAKPSEVASIEDLFDRTFHYTICALFLCAKALQWRGETNPPHMRTVDHWVQIASELNEWYHNRPHEFQPVLELGIQDLVPGSQETFPVILFINEQGSLAISSITQRCCFLFGISLVRRDSRISNPPPCRRCGMQGAFVALHSIMTAGSGGMYRCLRPC